MPNNIAEQVRKQVQLDRIARCFVNVTVHDRELLNAIEPRQLVAYVNSQGWRRHRDKEKREGIQIWSFGPGSNLVSVCASRQYDDYPQRVHDIVSILAKTQNRSQLLIIKEMLETEVNDEES
jgi:hypothetical protein